MVTTLVETREKFVKWLTFNKLKFVAHKTVKLIDNKKLGNVESHAIFLEWLISSCLFYLTVFLHLLYHLE
jgi:hypothetical protein